MSEEQFPELKQAATQAFSQSLNMFIRGYCRNEQLKTMGVHTFIIERDREIYESALMRAAIYGQIAKMSNDDVYHQILANTSRILTDFDEGYFHTGSYLGSLSRDDRSSLERLHSLLQQGGIKIPDNIDEADIVTSKDALTDWLNSKIERQTYRFQYLLNGVPIPSRQTVEVKPGEQALFEDSTLEIPLNPGKQIRLSLSTWNDKVVPIFSDTEGDNLLNHDFYIFNAPFYYAYPNRHKTNTSSIHTLDNKSLSQILRQMSTLRDNILAQIAMEKNGLFPPLTHKLTEEASSELVNIMARNLSINQQRPVRSFLEDLQNFIGESQSGEASLGIEEDQIAQLIGLYKRDNFFPGTCRAASYIVAACCESIGLRSRIIEGYLLDVEGEINGGHQWPEIYLPTIKQWVPVDAQGGQALLTYPSKSLVYFAHGKLYPQADSSITLRIN